MSIGVRLWPISSYNGKVMDCCPNGIYGYGYRYDESGSTYGIQSAILSRVNLASGIWEDLYTFSGTVEIWTSGASGVWVSKLTGDIYVVVRNTVSERYSLYASRDGGSTFTEVLKLGDFTDKAGYVSQTANVSILDGWAELQDGRIIVGEYNATADVGAPNYTCRIMISDEHGENFTELTYWGADVTDDTSGKVRHVHGCSVDPYTGHVWIVTGDNGEGGTAYTDYQSHIIEWDPDVGVWPDDTGGADLNALDGFTVWNSEIYGESADRFRGLSVAFTEKYALVTIDSTTTNNQGVWSINKESKAFRRRFTETKYQAETGWITTSKQGLGALMTFSIAAGVTYDRYTGAMIYATTNGVDIEPIARCMLEDTGAQVNISSIEFVPGTDRVLVLTTRAAGKEDPDGNAVKFQTVLCEWVEGSLPNNEPDIISPVYWVSALGSDSESGHTPGQAVETLQYLLVDHVTYGTRIMVDVVVNEDTSCLCNFTRVIGAVNPVATPVQVSGRYYDTKSLITYTIASDDVIKFATTNHTLYFENVHIQSTHTSAFEHFVHCFASLSIEMRFDDCIVDVINGQQFYMRSLDLTINRTILRGSNLTDDLGDMLFHLSSHGGGSLAVYNSVLLGGSAILRSDADITAGFYNCVIDSDGAHGVSYHFSGSSIPHHFENCFIMGEAAFINDDASVAVDGTGAVVRCYLSSGATTGLDPANFFTSYPIIDEVTDEPTFVDATNTSLALRDYSLLSPATGVLNRGRLHKLACTDLEGAAHVRPCDIGAVAFTSGRPTVSNRSTRS